MGVQFYWQGVQPANCKASACVLEKFRINIQFYYCMKQPDKTDIDFKPASELFDFKEMTKPIIVCCEDYMDNKFGVNVPIPLVWKEEFNDWAYEDCSITILLKTFKKYKQFIIHH